MGAELKFLAIAVSLVILCQFGSAQETQLAAGSQPISVEAGCVLRFPPLMTLHVSVWDRKTKEYIKDLKYTDFEIIDGSSIREIDYFQKPNDEQIQGGFIHHFALGFIVDDRVGKPKWHKLNVRLKDPKISRDLIVTAPNGYFL